MPSSNSLIIAIDYGTTYTGVAYCETSSTKFVVTNIQVVTDWPAAHTMIGTKEKVPSEIAYPPTGICWGSKIPPHIQRHTWTKLELDAPKRGEAERIREELGTAAYGVTGGLGYGGLGGLKRPVDIVADFLAEVQNHLIHNLDARYGPSLWRTLSVTLVVTVPAVWSDLAKNLTLQAIEKAGFNTTRIPQLKNTIMTTEPEAAAIYTIKALQGSVRDEQLKAGDGFVVLDMGGGTCDLISYRVAGIDPTSVVEATIGTGDQCGGSFVDRAFMQWLEEKLGQADFIKIAGKPAQDLARTSLPAKLGRMVQEFINTAKGGFSGAEDYYLRLPPALSAIEDEARGISDGEVHLTATDMKEMFSFPLDRTKALLGEQLHNVEKDGRTKVKYVFLVGGFAESPYMYRELSELAQQHKIQAIKPPNAWSSIVRGATIKGLEGYQQSPVRARLCRRHYGTPHNSTFNANKHQESEAYFCKYSGKKKAANQVDWLIAKGQALSTSEAAHGTITLQPKFWATEAKVGTIRLVSAEDNEAPQRSNDPAVRTVATLKVDLSSVPKKEFRKSRSPNGKVYYRLDCEVNVSLQGALEYYMTVDGVRYGTVTAEYA